jgi:hypothetical protein
VRRRPPSGSAPAPPHEPSEERTKRTDGTAASAAPRERARDEVWDKLEELFGSVGTAPRSNARSKRNRAAADLKGFGATPATIAAAAEAWPSVMPAGTTLTDIALATHYPQIALTLEQATTRKAAQEACSECGIGGGQHVAGCSLAARQAA